MTPSQRTIKRLFALSGNQCAFPKCDAPLVIDDHIIGEVCHICADRRLGPRFDANQTDEERQGYDNLILLCPSHHKVVDDDKDSYSPERLRRIKTDHEQHTIRVAEADAGRAAELFMSVGQSGGVAVNTINAGTINVYRSAQAESELDRDRKIARAKAEALHKSRCETIVGGEPPVAIMGGAVLILHLIPLQTSPDSIFQSSTDQAVAFRFPPFRRQYPADWRITYDGLLLGSNSNGLEKAQRAYVLWSSTDGSIESVSCWGASQEPGGLIQLPSLQLAITDAVTTYCNSLEAYGGLYPMLVAVSLYNARGYKLQSEHIGNAIWVDVPCAKVQNDACYFGLAEIEMSPDNREKCELSLRPILKRLANTAGLPEPYSNRLNRR